MPTFSLDHSWGFYAGWTAIAFFVMFFLNSFFEWALHRWVLHQRRALLPYPHTKHAIQHHTIFLADDTYHAKDDYMRQHITFTALDYVLILLANLPIWAAIELVTGRPWMIGGFLATLGGLQLFNSLHLRFHDPSDTWFQRTKAFLFLKEHHRLHHADVSKNFNVNFFPIADWLLGTLMTKQEAAPVLSSVPLTPEAPPVILAPTQSPSPSPVSTTVVLIEALLKYPDVVVLTTAATAAPVELAAVPATPSNVVAPLVEVIEIPEVAPTPDVSASPTVVKKSRAAVIKRPEVVVRKVRTAAKPTAALEEEPKFRPLTSKDWGFRKLHRRIQKSRSKAKVDVVK